MNTAGAGKRMKKFGQKILDQSIMDILGIDLNWIKPTTNNSKKFLHIKGCIFFISVFEDKALKQT